MSPTIQKAFEEELTQAIQINRNKSKHGRIWYHLERAHILSQSSAWLHLRIHIVMLLHALETSNWTEALGQIPRLLLAAPTSLLNKYPRGNNGRAYVPMFQPMAIPEDLKEIINGRPARTRTQ
jgi:hypothetical protein